MFGNCLMELFGMNSRLWKFGGVLGNAEGFGGVFQMSRRVFFSRGEKNTYTLWKLFLELLALLYFFRGESPNGIFEPIPAKPCMKSAL